MSVTDAVGLVANGLQVSGLCGEVVWGSHLSHSQSLPLFDDAKPATMTSAGECSAATCANRARATGKATKRSPATPIAPDSMNPEATGTPSTVAISSATSCDSPS